MDFQATHLKCGTPKGDENQMIEKDSIKIAFGTRAIRHVHPRKVTNMPNTMSQ